MAEPLAPELLAAVRAASDPEGPPVRSTEVMRTVTTQGGALTIISLEEWTTHLTVHWFFASAEPGPETERWLHEHPLSSAVDESGQQLVGAALGGSGGDGHHWTGTTWLAPRLPAAWKSLTLTVRARDGRDAEIPIDRS